jgi:coproporphyrinogen III oxidase
MTDDTITTERKARARAAFESLRDRLVASFEAIENEPGAPLSDRAPGKFVLTPTERFDEDGSPAGGGVMSVMKGRVFEKVAVNISTVDGKLSADAAKTLQGSDKDPRFWATSISVIAHMQNPHVPAVHMNTRHMITASENWFGGGSDLTPMFTNSQTTQEDARDFHAALQRVCDSYRPDAYAEYKKWCDEYFYLPHRKEPRGVGGIFFDRLNSGDWERDFAFTRDVGLAFGDIYPQIVRRRMGLPWTAEDRDHQLVRRGRYVEFNLLWDRGTQFGLKTGHNVDAILVSMPPEARWP